MIVNTVCRHASHIIPFPVDARVRARFFGSRAAEDAGGKSGLAEECVDIVVVSSCVGVCGVLLIGDWSVQALQLLAVIITAVT